MKMLNHRDAVVEAKARWGSEGDARRIKDRQTIPGNDVFDPETRTMHRVEVGYWVRSKRFFRSDKFVVMGQAFSRDDSRLPTWEEAFLDAHRREVFRQVRIKEEREKQDRLAEAFAQIRKSEP